MDEGGPTPISTARIRAQIFTNSGLLEVWRKIRSRARELSGAIDGEEESVDGLES